MEIQHTAFGTNALGILSMKSISSKRGFTLIELLVVITIIVIASSIIFVAGGGGGRSRAPSRDKGELGEGD